MRVLAPGRVVARTGYGSGYNTSPYMALPLDEKWIDVPDYFRQITNGNPVNDVIHAKIVDQLGVSLTRCAQVIHLKNGTLVPVDQVMLPDHHSGDLTFSYYAYTTSEEMVTLAPSPNYKGKAPKVVRKKMVVRHVHPICGTIRLVDYAPSPRDRWCNLFLSLDCLPLVVPNVRDYGTIQTVRFSCGTGRPGSGGTKWNSPHVLADFLDPLLPILDSIHGPYLTDEDWRSAIDAAKGRIYTTLTGIFRAHAAEIISTMQTKCGTWQATVYPCTDSPYPDFNYRELFYLNEPEIIGDRVDPLLAGKHGGLSNHWIQLSCQHALLEACESLPRLNDNSISNIIEVVGFIKALVVDHKIEIPKSLADAWLAYRYQYSTTKLDIEEAIKFVHRHMDLGTLDRAISGYGMYKFDYLDTTITCRCNVDVLPAQVNTLQRIWRALDTYGLTPDFYVIWDMIPYSFMVDWFLPVSDILSVWDANAVYFSGELYKFKDISFSLTYTREVGDYKLNFYTRWAGSVPSSLNSLYWFDSPSASSKTVGRRVLDTLSIFIGR